MSNRYADCRDLAAQYGQEHLLQFYSELSPEQQETLLDQVESIDFAWMQDLYLQAKAGQDDRSQAIEYKPLSAQEKVSLSDACLADYRMQGLELMADGRFAVVTMAGGQGTRLGHPGPKGTVDIGLPSGASLFEIQCMRLAEGSRLCGRTIPWYIMTSRENDEETRRFFQEHQYFGYDPQSIVFFTQKMLPMVDGNGKLLLEEKGKIREGADGHGGLFRAMLASGVVEDMKNRGISWIFVGGIDNVLVKPCDPVFLGFTHVSGCPLGAKTLIKRDAKEKVGVFCRKNGRPSVVEYTEISDEMAEARDEAGQFLYGDAHILCNLFHFRVFHEMGDRGLPYHVAWKATSFLNEKGEKVTPVAPNAYKFEAFLFDAFEYFDDIALFRTRREEEFAPVKNRSGEDSPETARALYLAAERG